MDRHAAATALTCCPDELWVPQLRALAPGHRGTVEVSRPGYLLVDTYDTLRQQVISHHVRFGLGHVSVYRLAAAG